MRVERGRFVISSEYRKDWVDRFRKIPGREFDWNKKEWSFPLSSLDAFIPLFPEFRISPEIILEAKRMMYPKENTLDFPDIKSFTGVLYPFQKVGVRFLITGKKVFLCDDMGTGKTVTSIAAACSMLENGAIDKVLVICPSSLKHQWEAEIARFTNRTHIKISGDRTKRQKLWEQAMGYDFIIINYEQIINETDNASITSLNSMFDLAFILDEATRIKSFRAKTSQKMKKFDAPVKFLLTGTPVENTPAELYSLNQFLDNQRLGSWATFDAKYQYRNKDGWVVGFKNLADLHDKIDGIMLRRKKLDVISDLPEKIINTYDIDMTDVELADYNRIKEIVLMHLQATGQAELDGNKAEFDIQKRALFQSMQFCKMFCDHPDLIRQSTSEQLKGLEIKSTTSSKLTELKYIVNEIVEGGNKVVVFTEFVRSAMIIAASIPNVVLYHGQMTEDQKAQAVYDFIKTDKYSVFCSTDAGSHGLNLQEAASYLINYDLPWNPSVLNQRIDRIHRIGQNNTVNVINLVISDDDVIEKEVMKVLRKKERMFDTVVDGR